MCVTLQLNLESTIDVYVCDITIKSPFDLCVCVRARVCVALLLCIKSPFDVCELYWQTMGPRLMYGMCLCMWYL